MKKTPFHTILAEKAKILGPKGQKQVGIAVSAERGQIVTFVSCFSATGVYIPPMIIFPRARMNKQLMKGAPVGSLVETVSLELERTSYEVLQPRQKQFLIDPARLGSLTK